MMPEVSPVRADKRIGDSAAEHVAAPRTRVTPNTLIALASIAALVAALIFLEPHSSFGDRFFSSAWVRENERSAAATGRKG